MPCVESLAGGASVCAATRRDVTAVRDIVAGALALAPAIPSMQFLHQSCTHPHRVSTREAVLGGTLWLVPALRAPGAAASRNDTERDAWLPPFWCVRRSACAAEANCEVAYIAVTSIHSVQLGGPPLRLPEPRMMDRETVQVSVLTNAKPVAAAQELVLLWQDMAGTKKAAPKRSPERLAEAGKAGRHTKSARGRGLESHDNMSRGAVTRAGGLPNMSRGAMSRASPGTCAGGRSCGGKLGWGGGARQRRVRG